MFDDAHFGFDKNKKGEWITIRLVELTKFKQRNKKWSRKLPRVKRPGKKVCNRKSTAGLACKKISESISYGKLTIWPAYGFSWKNFKDYVRKNPIDLSSKNTLSSFVLQT